MGDEKVPSFFGKKLITKEYILSLAANHLKDTDIFITGIKIGSDNSIHVFIDGDHGVTIDNCVALSRAIESQLDRNKEDFALDVSSHGATTPLVMPRQYPKHIGRNFEIKLLDGNKAEGTLVSCNNDGLVLEYTVRENKPVGKGKINVTKQHVINYNQIKESKIKLKY
ncbi:MAG: ribosome assembly cofactor RimP [Bacteroidia bacterium]|nr:ribosome assembly cofactor RimP [Bacteroidia bacterium]